MFEVNNIINDLTYSFVSVLLYQSKFGYINSFKIDWGIPHNIPRKQLSSTCQCEKIEHLVPEVLKDDQGLLGHVQKKGDIRDLAQGYFL